VPADTTFGTAARARDRVARLERARCLRDLHRAEPWSELFDDPVDSREPLDDPFVIVDLTVSFDSSAQ